ncbi:hypothetical protein NM688_g2189 [Phlebia brevispora]|uniref:Uncharacterized protein n=1 Tax=Phlebia brevispora TaxID=194682 RepID=A0ACC1T935_9APHY|nr:hypothetical protein NM688_g2189 [Phlebia brevispora]
MSSPENEPPPECAVVQHAKAEITKEVATRTLQLDELHRQSERIQREICELNTRRNRLALISRLPDEVLALILEAYVAKHWSAYTPPETNDDWSMPPYRWFVILHVCHDWRRIAFSTHRLWTCIVPTRRVCVQFMLEHIGTLPLHIRFGRPPKESAEISVGRAYREVLKRLPRMRVAQLRITAGARLQLAAMEKNGLNGDDLIMEELSVDMFIPLDNIPFLSSARLPRLTSLGIQYGSLALLDSLRRPTLTSLKFSLQYKVDHIGALTFTLTHLPLLRHLDLSLGLPRRFNAQPNLPGDLEGKTIVHLRHLESLSLEACVSQVSELLDLLMFPYTTSVQLGYIGSATELEYQHAMDTVALKMIPPNTTTSETTASVFKPYSIAIDDKLLVVELWDRVHTWQEVEKDASQDIPKPRLRVAFKGDRITDETSVDLIWRLLTPFDLSDVLTMHVALGLPIIRWIALFGIWNFPNLRSIWLQEEDAILAVLGALATAIPPLEDLPDGPTERFLFPNLENVHIMLLPLHLKPDQPTEHDVMPHLKALLELRAERVRKFGTITLHSCYNVGEEDIAALNELCTSEHACRHFDSTVWDFESDGVQLEDDDSEDDWDDIDLA